MADNTVLNTGSGGDTIATDDIGGVKYPRSKISLGADGTAVDAVAGAGAVDTGTQRVTLASDDPAVTALELLDNAISGAGFNVTQFAGATVPIGAGVEATALRVTLATDSTGVVSIDDNGGALTVDNGGTFAVQAAQSGTWTVDLGATDNAVLDAIAASVAGTLTVGSHAVTNAGTFAVQVDGAALTALQLIDNLVLAEDAGHVSSDPGVQALAVRSDSDASLCGTDLDYTPLQVDANGYLKVNIKAGAGSGGTASTDDAAFTAGSGSGTPAMGYFSADTVDAGDVGVLAMDASRRLLVSIDVDNVGIGGGTQYAVDAALGATPTGTLAVAIRDDALSALTPVEGDAIGLRVDANGALWVIPSGTVTVTGSGGSFPVTDSGGSLTIDNAALSVTGTGTESGALRVTLANDSTGVLSIDDNGGAITVDGTVDVGTVTTVTTVSTVTTCSTVTTLTGSSIAHDSADSGNPHKVGMKATTSLSGVTLVANADRTDVFAGVDGVPVVRLHCNLEDIVSGNASNTDGASTECIAAQAAGVKTYLTKVTLTNTSSTFAYVEIKDGTTVKHTIPVPATGGATVLFDPPLPGTAATAWNFDPSAATTTMICSMVGFKSKV